MKAFRWWIGFVLTIGALIALMDGVTVNGKHYGVKGCGGDSGLEIDVGAEVKR